VKPESYDSKTELCCEPCHQQEPAAAHVTKRARTEYVLQLPLPGTYRNYLSVPLPSKYVDGDTTWWELGKRKVLHIRSSCGVPPPPPPLTPTHPYLSRSPSGRCMILAVMPDDEL
jgi:hypothetical protein